MVEVGEATMPSDADVHGTIRNLTRRLRFDHGEMTQQELAVRVGVTRQTIIALEAGKYVPSLLLAFRLARAFGVSVEGVFQYHDGEHSSPAVKAQDGK
jgi:putative transcriptional regulator